MSLRRDVLESPSPPAVVSKMIEIGRGDSEMQRHYRNQETQFPTA
jgi:hypothetical protein